MKIRLPRHLNCGALLLALLLAIACRNSTDLPAKTSKDYDAIVRSFYVGLAALQVGDDLRADSELARLTQLAPAEPAGWGNWGMLALRQRNFELAAERLQRARTLAPDNDQIYYLIGLLERARGRSAEAITALRKAIELNPRNLFATFALAEEIERQGGDQTAGEYQQLMQKILEIQPDNLAALLELGRIAAKRGDGETLRQTVDNLTRRSAAWPAEVQQQLTELQSAATGANPQAAATRIVFLRNVLVRVAEFRKSLANVKPPPGEEAQPFLHFVKMESPVFSPAPPDVGLSFSSEPLPQTPSGTWSWLGAVSLSGEGAPLIVVANQKEVRIGNGSYLFPGAPSNQPLGPEAIMSLDFNYDFKTDLVLAGDGGMRLLKAENAGKFVDVTAQTKLPDAILHGHFEGTWAADIDSDGDLDIVLGAEHGSPTVARNNGDGSFAEIHPFPNVSGQIGFIWADIDGDGDPDAALIDDQNKLRFFTNERSGQFKVRTVPASLRSVLSICVADVTQDGRLDLLAVQDDGVIVALSDRDEGMDWQVVEVARLSDSPSSLKGTVRLMSADLDNNGRNDLLLTSSNAFMATGETTGVEGLLKGPTIWLGEQDAKFKLLQAANYPGSVFSVADVNGDGQLDLLGINEHAQPIEAMNHGTRAYHWQVVRPRAAQATGDQRINSFGIGGEMEIRAGLLVQKQLVTGPIVHFGLGDHTGADVVRIVWPNGAVRAEFETNADQTILAEQRLKGSCPFLFAYNGSEMKFVKDTVPWGSAIGLRINTLGTAQVESTEEWYKIGGNELRPREGYYDLRITAELWETYYYDHLALLTVDHAAGTEIFVDERFVIPPAKLAITAVETPHQIAHAEDDTSADVTGIVTALDGKYLDNFERGRYQGVTRDHYVEVDLGPDIPSSGPLWLVAKGWMHPTDSSINVAISQGQDIHPQPLSLEVPDGKGGWRVARGNLGFPAGRKKICLFDLEGLFPPGIPHRLRLRTNLEIFWDSLEWAKGLPDLQLRTTRLQPVEADLNYRGYSVIEKPNASSPEVPEYNRLSSSKQIWRDLIGYYTRFGDVRELLDKVDDRYVIMNAGDQMSLRFAEQPPSPPGWVRDYVFLGDGWIKDGDFNSTFSKTVLPLPYHQKQKYTTAPGRLEDEWAYRQHPDDWQKYHTRYVTPAVFQSPLR